MRRPEQRERIENAERELEENVAGARTARPPREQRSRGQAKSTIESRSPSNNRYAARFQQRPKAFIPFTLLGFPNQATSISIIKTMIDAGAHSLELGIAFSDPIADGPTIQQAAHEVIDSGFTTADALDVCAEVRSYSPDVPMSLLVYSNTIRAYGEENFCHDAALAGVDGITIVDLPPESAEHFVATARRYNLACVFLVSPVSSPARVEKIMQLTDGYHYMLSRLGITGSIERYDDVLSEKIFELKSLSSLPVCIGFGISKPEQAKRMIEMGADGVITGSAILELCRSTNFCLESLAEYVSSMATGLGAQPQSQPDFACLSAR